MQSMLNNNREFKAINLPQVERKGYFEKAVAEITQIVGDQNLKIDLDERLHYARSTLAYGAVPSAVVCPANADEIVSVVKIANLYRLPIHPISTGKNWGYSDANAVTDGQILLNLNRMNRILEVNVASGYITIEPGVTQGQVFEYLQQNQIPLWMDATGAGPDTSVIGNTMDRGFGHSPHGDRYAHSCGYEVILPNGEIIQTGFGRFKNSKVTEIYKWGVGPALDGLFTQSNLGIVTKMTFWLMPAPKEFCVVGFMLKSENDICELIDRLAPLRMDGTLKSVVHIGNDLRMISMSRSYPFAEKPEGGSLTMLERKRLARQQGVGFWSGTAGFYGSKDQVKADIRRLKEALKGFKGLHSMLVMTESRLQKLEKLISFFGFIKSTRHFDFLLKKARLAFELLKGSSPKNCVQGGLWRVRNPGKIETSDPLDYQAGFYWISPVIPMQGNHIQNLISLVEPVFHQFGFDLQQTLSMTTERALTSVMTISFDKRNEIESQKAKQCHDVVVQKLLDEGYILYRAGNHTMSKIAENSDCAYEKLLKNIKSVLDPNHILSPGKYI